MISRRQFNQFVASIGLTTAIIPTAYSQNPGFLSKTIPQSGEKIAPIGMGTWITFDKQSENVDVVEYIKILQHFFQQGGQMIDSSPMYGYAQQFVGALLSKVENKSDLFSATKVWIPGKKMGIQQMKKISRTLGA